VQGKGFEHIFNIKKILQFLAEKDAGEVSYTSSSNHFTSEKK